LPALKSLLVSFADQTALVLPIKNYPELTDLKAVELKKIGVGFAGSALCLDERDLHISIAGLVSASVHLMEMAATVVASCNGQRRSPAKARASRENGAKGGATTSDGTGRLACDQCYPLFMPDSTADLLSPSERETERVFVATDSPCVAVCSTLFDDVCRGCGRTAMEVANWVLMTDPEKQVVWQRICAQGYPRRKG
jgi:predicted Fe-S protein YdhL (DUF1289 family)